MVDPPSNDEEVHVPSTYHRSVYNYWWTTSGTVVYLPTQARQSSLSTQSVASLFFLSNSGAVPSSPSLSISNSNDPTGNVIPGGSSMTLTTITTTTLLPITIISPSTTYTTSSPSQIIESLPLQTNPFTPQSFSHSTNVCIGNGIDISAIGIISTAIFSALLGLLIWLLFGLLRPRFRQLYALREWFLQPELRPPPLRTTFWAFLFPHVPLVPPLPSDVSSAGSSPAHDAHLFPSDEQLAQRTLWIAFLLVLGWTILGLGGALPLYLVSTPCVANTAPDTQFGGGYSTMQDLSIVRLLELLDRNNISVSSSPPPSRRSFIDSLYLNSSTPFSPSSSSSNPLSLSLHSLSSRAIVNTTPLSHNTKVRLIILTVLVLIVATIPALYKLRKEFLKLLSFHARWLSTRCDNQEMVWLSLRKNPGLRGWSEARLKDFFVRGGLSVSLAAGGGGGGSNTGQGGGGGAEIESAREEYLRSGTRRSRSKRRGEGTSASGGGEYVYGKERDEEERLEIDVTGVYTISDTHDLTLLIAERTQILNKLEIAEAEYIHSFRLGTPSPGGSQLVLSDVPRGGAGGAEIEKVEGEGTRKSLIGRPRLLGGTNRSKRTSDNGRHAPTSYVAPSPYYRLRGLHGSGGRLSSSSSFQSPSPSPVVGGSDSPSPGPHSRQPTDQSLTRQIDSRVIGSRFQEVNRDSIMFGGKIPMGSRVKVRPETGELGPASPTDTSFRDSAGPGIAGLGSGGGVRREGEGDVRSWVEDEDGTGTGTGGGHWAYTPEPGSSPTDPYHYIRGDSAGAGRRPSTQTPGLGPRGDTPMSESVELFPSIQPRPTTYPAEDSPTAANLPPAPHMRLDSQQPLVRPLSGINQAHLAETYTSIGHYRSQLKSLNTRIIEAQQEAFEDVATGAAGRVKGFLVLGRGVGYLSGSERIEGRGKDDVRWADLQADRGVGSDVAFWVVVGLVAVLLAASLIPVVGLALTSAPDFAHYFPFLDTLSNKSPIAVGIVTVLVPALAATLFIAIALVIVNYAERFSGSVSISQSQLTVYKATFFILIFIAGIWLIAVSAVLFGLQSFNTGNSETHSVSNGSIYIVVLLLAMVLNAAIIAPGLLLLQPFQLWRVMRAQRRAVTPRQRFRAQYPRTYRPTFATACCVLAVFFAATVSLLFPLIGPAVLLLVFLTLIAHRFLVGYVYGRTSTGQTGGLLQIWLIRRFANMLSLQPLLLGLILLSRQLWVLGGVSLGAAGLILVGTEAYARRKLRQPKVTDLSNITQDSLETFKKTATHRPGDGQIEDESFEPDPRRTTTTGGHGTRPTRSSIASVLDMMSATLAVGPSAFRRNGALPLPSEKIDDLVSTERAARTHPDAPPQLTLTFHDRAEETAGLLYPPELLAPPPTIWLPNDSAGIARSEANDLQTYHGLEVTLDVVTEKQLERAEESSGRD